MSRAEMPLDEHVLIAKGIDANMVDRVSRVEITLCNQGTS